MLNNINNSSICNNINSNNNLKDSVITIRCTKHEKEIMETKARQLNISTSQYLLDSGIAGTERRRTKDRKRIKGMIEYNESLNSLFNIIQKTSSENNPEELKECIDDLLNRGAKIWLS